MVKKFEVEYAEKIARDGKLSSDIPIFDYMCAYYRKVQKNIQKSTAESYHEMIYGRIQRYFTAHSNLTVGNITSRDFVVNCCENRFCIKWPKWLKHTIKALISLK